MSANLPFRTPLEAARKAQDVVYGDVNLRDNEVQDRALIAAIEAYLASLPQPPAPIPEGAGERVETGPVRIDGDWAGVFIRGDRAVFYSAVLKMVLKSTDDLNAVSLQRLADELASCREPVDAVPLSRSPPPPVCALAAPIPPALEPTP